MERGRRPFGTIERRRGAFRARYFGPDRVHPSAAGYELCFRLIEHRTRLVAELAARADRAQKKRPA